MSLTLYTYPNNFRALKCAVVANYCDIDITVPSAEEFKFPEALKSDEFKKLNPNGQVPVLVTPEGPIFESNAILRYLARSAPRSNLLGRSFYEQALVDQWLDFSALDLEAVRNVCVYPLQGIMKIDAAAAKKGAQDLNAKLAILNAHLAGRTYMVGERLTVADIAIASVLVECFKRVLSPMARDKFAHVTRWFLTLVNQDFWKKVQGDIKLCEVAEKPETGKKQKDIWAKKKMNLDAIKRIFKDRNKDFETQIAEFWGGFEKDTTAYSLYTSEYNYNDQNTDDMKVDNLITGYLQRLEMVKKEVFGTINAWGIEETKGPFIMNTAFVFVGEEAPKRYYEVPDADSYTLTKIDPTNPADKKKFEAYLGRAINMTFDGKDMPLYKRKIIAL